MGAFYTNIVLRGPEQPAVVEELRRQQRRAFVSLPLAGCTVVYDEACESQDERVIQALTESLSGTFNCPALAALVHDDDVLMLWLYRAGALVEAYNSDPGYFSDDSEAAPSGNAAALCEAFGVPGQEPAAREILEATDEYLFATDRHAALAKVLQLPSFSVGLGYHYIEQGEWPENFSSPAHTGEQPMSKKPQRGFGGRPGGAPNQAAMLRQIQKMQEDMEAAQQALETETVEVSVGGGAVTVVITGSQKIQSITVNREMIDLEDEEWLSDLQDLLVAAVNQAVEKAQALASDRMGGVTGGLDSMLPGGLGGLFG